MSTKKRIKNLKDNICRTVGHDYSDSVCTRCNGYMPAQALLEGSVGSMWGVNMMVSDNVPRDMVAWEGRPDKTGFTLIGSEGMIISVTPGSKKRKKKKAKKKK